jgi:hypothetical protein
MPHAIRTESKLEERLTVPSEQDIEAASRLEGDVILLGAGGKIGPSLATRMARAIEAAGLKTPSDRSCVQKQGWPFPGIF